MPRRRESLSYLQQAEAVEIRRKSDAFQQRVEDFRAFFLQAAPFAIPAGSELTSQHARSLVTTYTCAAELLAMQYASM